MFPSLKRPDGFLDKVHKSLETLMPEKSKMEELIRIQADDLMFIPLYNVSEILRHSAERARHGLPRMVALHCLHP